MCNNIYIWVLHTRWTAGKGGDIVWKGPNTDHPLDIVLDSFFRYLDKYLDIFVPNADQPLDIAPGRFLDV